MILKTFTGNIGRKNELKDVGGTQLLNFSVGSSFYSSKTKDYQTKWHNCSAWGKQAEYVHNKISVGQFVTVSGECTYDTKDEKEYENIRVNVITAAPKKSENGGGAEEKSAETKAVETKTATDPLDDIPF